MQTLQCVVDAAFPAAYVERTAEIEVLRRDGQALGHPVGGEIIEGLIEDTGKVGVFPVGSREFLAEPRHVRCDSFQITPHGPLAFRLSREVATTRGVRLPVAYGVEHFLLKRV